MMRRIVHCSLVSLFVLVIGAGCASTTKTVRTETAHYPSGGPPVVERQTTVTTETQQEGSEGVLSSTVNVIGEVIALPFRAVGGLARAIF